MELMSRNFDQEPSLEELGADNEKLAEAVFAAVDAFQQFGLDLAVVSVELAHVQNNEMKVATTRACPPGFILINGHCVPRP